MLETSVKGQTLLLLLLVATMSSHVNCGVKVFNSGKTLHIQQVNGTGEVCSAVFIAQRLLIRRTR